MVAVLIEDFTADIFFLKEIVNNVWVIGKPVGSKLLWTNEAYGLVVKKILCFL